jgi:hypothetical protein
MVKLLYEHAPPHPTLKVAEGFIAGGIPGPLMPRGDEPGGTSAVAPVWGNSIQRTACSSETLRLLGPLSRQYCISFDSRFGQGSRVDVDVDV